MIGSILPQIAESVHQEFEGRALGHCVRVDGLGAPEAQKLSKLLSDRHDTNCRAFVLNPAPDAPSEIRPDQAIEARNRKDQSVCLIVPSDLRHNVPDSLANAFAEFDL